MMWFIFVIIVIFLVGKFIVLVVVKRIISEFDGIVVIFLFVIMSISIINNCWVNGILMLKVCVKKMYEMDKYSVELL